MKLLALETSAKAASCAVLEDGSPIASAWQQSGLTHSRTLMPMVEDMLHNSDLSLADMDAIAISAGPGSFTGLRIGIAAVKGLAWAAEKPCVAVSTLEGMASPLSHMDSLIVCAMDARRQQVYNALFRAENGQLTRVSPDRAISLEELAAELEKLNIRKIIVGDGASLCCNYMTGHGIPCELAPAHLRVQSAVGVGIAATQMFRRGETVTAQELTPVYLRLSQAERERLERMKQG